MKNHYELVFCQLLSELKRIGMSRNRVTEYQQLTERFLKDYNSGLISSYDDFVDKLSKTTIQFVCGERLLLLKQSEIMICMVNHLAYYINPSTVYYHPTIVFLWMKSFLMLVSKVEQTALFRI